MGLHSTLTRENAVDQNYLFNGKELQDELGLNWEDYGARMFDPALGRWWVIDPLTEIMPGHSPYSYAFNNPIKFVDLFGMAPESSDNGFDDKRSSFISPEEKRSRAEDERVKNGGSPRLTTCATCPQGKEYDKFRDTDQKFAYNKDVGVYNDVEASVSGSRWTPFDEMASNYQSGSYLNSNPDDHNDYSPMQFPDAIGVSGNLNFYPGAGSGDGFIFILNLRQRETQLFGYFDAGVGNDVSIGSGVSLLNFMDNKNWKDDYSENFSTVEAGLLGVSVNHSENYNRTTGVHGGLTNSVGIGLSFGSDQIPYLGAVNVRVSHGYTYRINMQWQK